MNSKRKTIRLFIKDTQFLIGALCKMLSYRHWMISTKFMNTSDLFATPCYTHTGGSHTVSQQTQSYHKIVVNQLKNRHPKKEMGNQTVRDLDSYRQPTGFEKQKEKTFEIR